MTKHTNSIKRNKHKTKKTYLLFTKHYTTPEKNNTIQYNTTKNKIRQENTTLHDTVRCGVKPYSILNPNTALQNVLDIQ